MPEDIAAAISRFISIPAATGFKSSELVERMRVISNLAYQALDECRELDATITNPERLDGKDAEITAAQLEFSAAARLEPAAVALEETVVRLTQDDPMSNLEDITAATEVLSQLRRLVSTARSAGATMTARVRDRAQKEHHSQRASLGTLIGIQAKQAQHMDLMDWQRSRSANGDEAPSLRNLAEALTGAIGADDVSDLAPGMQAMLMRQTQGTVLGDGNTIDPRLPDNEGDVPLSEDGEDGRDDESEA